LGVTVGAASDEPSACKGRGCQDDRPRRLTPSDRDACGRRVEALGELQAHITAEVDLIIEAANDTTSGRQASASPALLFREHQGHPGSIAALYNMVRGCKPARFCLMIGEQPVDHSAQGGVQIPAIKEAGAGKMPPKEVSAEQAICNQKHCRKADDIDIPDVSGTAPVAAGRPGYISVLGDAVVPPRNPGQTGRSQCRHPIA